MTILLDDIGNLTDVGATLLKKGVPNNACSLDQRCIMGKCPGMDPSHWKLSDIAEHPCACGTLIEFWKDDVKRVCPNCGKVNFNPNLGNVCLSWCARAVECLGNQDIEEWKQKTAAERATAAACNSAKALNSEAEDGPPS